MTVVKRVSRLLVILLTVALILSSVTVPTFAKRSNKTHFQIKIHVADKLYAGTDSSIYFKIYLVNGKHKDFKLDKSGYNDFERNDTDTYHVDIDYPQWMVKSFGLSNSGNDGMCLGYINVNMWDPNEADVHSIATSKNPGSKWLEDSEYKFDPGEDTKRNLTEDSYTAFKETFARKVYVTSASSGTTNVTWTPTLNGDGYNKKATSTYDPYTLDDAPTLTTSVKAMASNNTWVTALANRFEPIMKEYNNKGVPIGFKYNPKDVYNDMVSANYNVLAVEVTWTFPTRSSKGTTTKTVTYNIYRKNFEFGEPKIETKAYTALKDNYFYNSSSTELKISIPVQGGLYRSNYDPAGVAADYAQRATGSNINKIKLYYGKGASDYFNPSSVSASGSNIILKFNLSSRQYETVDASAGLKLLMQNVEAAPGSSDIFPNSGIYTLYDSQSFYQGSARSVTLGGSSVTLGNGAYYRDLSKYKFDNIAPNVSVSAADGSGLTGTWQQKLTVSTTVDRSEQLFPRLNPYGESGNEKERGLFEVTLYRPDGKTPVRVKNAQSNGSIRVPVKAGTKTTFTPTEVIENNNLILRIVGYDFAGNKFTKDVTGVYLDNKAPEVSVKRTDLGQAEDLSKSLLFTFDIKEGSNTGRVNYCFVRSGDPIPPESGWEAVSGVIETTIGRWAYIEQAGQAAAGAVLKMGVGDSFEGTLYYYAVDAAGNKSDLKSSAVSVINQSANCDITIAPYTHPLPDYDITITAEENCEVYYRYTNVDENGELTTSRNYIKYDASRNPGSSDADVASVSGAASVASKLNGNVILEYKVINTVSGNALYRLGGFGIPLVFDNTVPELSITQNSKGSSLAAHTFTISASDISGVASASYKVLTAGSETQVASGNLDIVAGSGLLNTVLSTVGMDLANGSYVLSVTAVDMNGQQTAAVSDPFSVRTSAPAATVQLNGQTPAELNYVTDPAYTVGLDISDAFRGAAEAHSVYWRASYDGSAYTPWQLLTTLQNGETALTAEVDLDTPLALMDGYNDVYIQLACAESTKILSKEAPVDDSILTLDPIHCMLDTEAPSIRWNMTSGRNNTAIVGTLTVADNLCEAPAITSDCNDVTITPSDAAGKYDIVYAVPEGGTQVPSFKLIATDDCGNSTETVVTTESLDIGAPVITIADPVYLITGDRKDADITVTIQDHAISGVNFTLSDNAQGYTLVDQISTGVYRVRMRGFTGTASFSVEASDDLYNKSVATSGNIEVAYPDLAFVGMASQPLYAMDTAPVSLRFNMPAAVGLTREEAIAAAEKAINNGTLTDVAGCVLVTDDVAEEGTRSFTVWAVGEFSDPVSFTVTPDTIFAKDFDIDFELVQYVDGVPVASPEALIKGVHVADPSVPGDADHTYTAQVIISTQNEIIGPDPADPTQDRLLGAQSLQAFTIVTAGDSRITTGTAIRDVYEEVDGEWQIVGQEEYVDFESILFEDYDSKNTLFAFNMDEKVEAHAMDDINAYGLERMVFDLDGSGSSNQDSARLNIGFIYNDCSGLTDENPFPVFAHGEGDMIGVRYYYMHYDWDTEEETFEMSGQSFELPPDTVWLNKSYQIDKPIIVAAPEISYSWSQSTIEPKAVITADADGRGCEIETLKLLKKVGNDWVAVETYTAPATPQTGGNDTSEELVVAQTISPHVELTVEEGGVFRLYSENEYGLSTLTDEFTVAIYTDPIHYTDYDVEILIDTTGDGNYVPDDGASYALSAKAVVTPTASGDMRGLYVTNCGGAMEYMFDEHSTSFTFGIADMYGYTAEETVSFDRIDIDAPTLAYTLGETGKTNQPYGIDITATDGESGIASVVMKLAGTEQTLTPGAAGHWTGTISASGSYLITATDLMGNRSQRSFTVTNINTVAPTVTSMVRNVPEGTPTQQTITVQLNFSKPGVTIYKVENANNDNARCTLNKDTSTLSFSANGTVTVFFRDDYGNEGTAVVTVSDIYDKPPMLKAVAELAEDELSVKVKFVQQTDENTGAPLDIFHDIADLTVMQNGVAYNAKTAEFYLRDNGEYTFTVIDQIGLTQVIQLTVTQIDRSAPTITAVSWTYTYLDASGNEQNAVYDLSNITGAGYVIADDVHPRTFNPVTVTVTTDAPTALMGVKDAMMQNSHELIYRENGLFIFNLEKHNGLSTSYGVDVEIIDLDRPVITLNGGSQLMFIEGKATGSVRSMIEDFTAVDTFRGIDTDLTGDVVVSYGSGEHILDPDHIENNTFDKSKPYTVTYTVKDAAGNTTTVSRQILLIGINDVLVTVNGELPDAAFMAEVEGGNVRLDMVNFSGRVYMNYARGMNSFGQMKTKGTFVAPVNGSFTVNGLESGWYTFFVQTEMRDYFNIYVYVK